MNILIYIAGTTAIGKTALSIKLAQHFGCEIISCDSRQFFKEMTIGTAVPDEGELKSVKHHFIHHLSIKDKYDIGSFEKDSLEKLNELFTKNNIQILVGGSGLYADALIKGLDYFPDVDEKIRENLSKELEEKGIEYLQNKLKELDFESYNSVAIDNPHRLMRALEICIGTGKTYSSFKNKPKKPRNFKTIKIGLTADREIIYNRINKRVDIMMEKGLLDEVKTLIPYKNLNALKTVGYSELFNYFDGKYDLDFAIEEIKKNTRRFAKRQLTWYRKDQEIIWFNYNEDVSNIINEIEKNINKL